MTVLRKDIETFLMFHNYARLSLDNRLTTLVKVQFIFFTSEIQSFWLLDTNILEFLIAA